jgi:hypothetical protein
MPGDGSPLSRPALSGRFHPCRATLATQASNVPINKVDIQPYALKKEALLTMLMVLNYET